MSARARLSYAALGAPLLGLVTLVGVLAAIEALIRADVINRFVVPTPSEVLAAIPRIVTEEEIPHRFWQTMQEALWASALLIVAGVGLGMLMFRFRLLRSACETWVAALASAPIVLMYPLFLVVFGRSATTIVMIGFVAGLPPVVLKTVEGLAGTRRVLLDVGRSFRLGDWQLFRKILLPAALPSIFVGLRVGLIFALINIVGVEFLINFGGLGQLINELAERYDLPGTYGAIGFVILVSVLFFVAAERAERWLLPRA
ncbi:MAG: ABC transporter permease [Betaproteobacteria bacterium]